MLWTQAAAFHSLFSKHYYGSGIWFIAVASLFVLPLVSLAHEESKPACAPFEFKFSEFSQIADLGLNKVSEVLPTIDIEAVIAEGSRVRSLPNGTSLRQINWNDLPQFKQLVFELFDMCWEDWQVAAFTVANREYSVVLVDHNKSEHDGIIGFISGHLSNDDELIPSGKLRSPCDNPGYVSAFGVRSGYQNKGYGRILLNTQIDAFRTIGKCDCVFLEAKVSNTRAIEGLYKKSGFDEFGLLREYYGEGEDAVMMVKSFSNHYSICNGSILLYDDSDRLKCISCNDYSLCRSCSDHGNIESWKSVHSSDEKHLPLHHSCSGCGKHIHSKARRHPSRCSRCLIDNFCDTCSNSKNISQVCEECKLMKRKKKKKPITELLKRLWCCCFSSE